MSDASALSCKRCRDSHLKCDRGEPKCSRCAKSNWECQRTIPRPPKKKARLADTVKHQPQFPPGQPWLEVTNSITFLEGNDPDVDEEDRLHEATQARVIEPPKQVVSKDAALDVTPHHEETALSSHPNQSEPSVQTSYSPDVHGFAHVTPGAGASGSHTSQVNHSSPWTPGVNVISPDTTESDRLTPNNQPSELYHPAPTFPEHEAKLMRHFITKLAPIIDICDPKRTFGRAVPRLAVSSPVLLSAIFSASSKHLSKMHKPTNPPAEHYIQDCLDHLIPMLSKAEASVEDHLLVAVVILRFMEEMDVPLTGHDQQSHLPAVHALLSAQERHALSGGIRQAAFWVGFRQEVVVAFINQRRIVPVLEHCNIDRTFSSADERTWTNRMIVHCADVITYCFGDGQLNVSRYRVLDRYAQDWMAHKPVAFDVLYQYTPKNGQFLHLCYAGDTIVAGIQHYHLAQILLAAHDPTIPRIGPQRKIREQLVNDNLRSHVRALCGIAQANDTNAAHWVCACLGISLCGDRFTAPAEQQALLSILRHTETNYARYTNAIQAHLTEAWA